VDLATAGRGRTGRPGLHQRKPRPDLRALTAPSVRSNLF
jgi:hypothetical protein